MAQDLLPHCISVARLAGVRDPGQQCFSLCLPHSTFPVIQLYIFIKPIFIPPFQFHPPFTPCISLLLKVDTVAKLAIIAYPPHTEKDGELKDDTKEEKNDDGGKIVVPVPEPQRRRISLHVEVPTQAGLEPRRGKLKVYTSVHGISYILN